MLAGCPSCKTRQFRSTERRDKEETDHLLKCSRRSDSSIVAPHTQLGHEPVLGWLAPKGGLLEVVQRHGVGVRTSRIRRARVRRRRVRRLEGRIGGRGEGQVGVDRPGGDGVRNGGGEGLEGDELVERVLDLGEVGIGRRVWRALRVWREGER